MKKFPLIFCVGEGVSHRQELRVDRTILGTMGLPYTSGMDLDQSFIVKFDNLINRSTRPYSRDCHTTRQPSRSQKFTPIALS